MQSLVPNHGDFRLLAAKRAVMQKRGSGVTDTSAREFPTFVAHPNYGRRLYPLAHSLTEPKPGKKSGSPARLSPSGGGANSPVEPGSPAHSLVQPVQYPWQSCYPWFSFFARGTRSDERIAPRCALSTFPRVRKINTNNLAELTWSSPNGKFTGAGKESPRRSGASRSRQISSSGIRLMSRSAASRRATTPYPYHSHSAQWELYHVISGTGTVRHQDGTTRIEPGDAFLFQPGQPHQLINDGTEDLVLYVVADNPLGESCHYPDSGKWLVRSPDAGSSARKVSNITKERSEPALCVRVCR